LTLIRSSLDARLLQRDAGAQGEGGDEQQADAEEGGLDDAFDRRWLLLVVQASARQCQQHHGQHVGRPHERHQGGRVGRVDEQPTARRRST
jgi:hypothetical protein